MSICGGPDKLREFQVISGSATIGLLAAYMKDAIECTRFPNGLTVLSDRMEGVRSATLGFFFRVGARHEPAELNGITHFIEHCVFKGSHKRSARDIAAEQDRLGGSLDAFTTHEETGFVIKVVDDQFDHAFDLLADMIGRPLFEAGDLASERKVIIEEVKMNEDTPDEVISDIFHREFFPGNPLGRTITGPPDVIATFDRDMTESYHRQAFDGANLVIAAAGNVDHDRLLKLVQDSSFGSAAHTNGNAKPTAATPATAAPLIVEHRPDLEQAHLFMATPIVSGRDHRRYAADLLTNILGGGTSSRLWQTVREERGLAYSVGASPAMFIDCGFIAITAATSPDQIGEVADIVTAELGNLARDGVTNDELELMKDQARASILLGLEDSAARAGTLASCEMVHGRQIPLEETLGNLAAVTTEDVNELAREFFQTEKLALIALGDIEDFDLDRSRFTL